MIIDTLIERVDNTTQILLDSFSKLSISQMNWKPDPQTWSIAQNLDHIIKNNESYFQVFDALHKKTYSTPFISKFGWFSNSFGKTILKAVQPDRRKKIKTFPMWEPSTNPFGADILTRFTDQQDELKKHLQSFRDIAEPGMVISSPANRFIVYSLETAFEVIVTHGERHLAQACEILHILPR